MYVCLYRIDDEITDDGTELGADNVYKYLSNVMYARRLKMNPLWNTFVVAGYSRQTREPVLGCVDLHGTTWQSPSIATGFGAYLVQPLLRKHLSTYTPGQTTYEQARKVVEDCMRVLFYRDARSLNRIQIGVVWKDAEKGIEISEPFELKTEWAFAEDIRGYGRVV